MANYKYDNPDDAYKEAQRRIKQAKDESATRLDLSELGLMVVPSEIEQLIGLDWLDLSQNRLIAVPFEITKLTKLLYLRLLGNPDLPIPSEILVHWNNPRVILGYLQAVHRIKKAKDESATELNLRDLGLTAVPPTIGLLTMLMKLYLGDNNLAAVPLEI